MKAIRRIIVIVLALFLFGCSNNVVQDPDNHSEESDMAAEIADTKNETVETVEEDLTDLIGAPYKAKSVATIKVRIKPSVDAAIRGYVRPDDCFEVFETTKDDKYIWCRIGTNAWVANDGTWIERIPYNSIIEADYPDLINPATQPKKIENSYVSGQSYGPDGNYSKGESVTTYLFDDAGKFMGCAYENEESGIKYEYNYMDFGIVGGFYIGSKVINKEENGLIVSQMIDNRKENKLEYDSDGRIIKSSQPYNLTDVWYSYRYEDGRLVEFITTFGELDPLFGDTKYDDDGRLIESIDSIEYNGNIVLINNEYSGNHMAGEGEHALIRVSSGRIEETSWAGYSYDAEYASPDFSNSILIYE